MILQLAGRQAAGVQRQDLLVEAGQTDLALADQLGIEAAVAIARNGDLDLAGGVDHPLVGLAVAAVAAAVTVPGVLLVAEMIGQLGVQGCLDQALLQLPEKTAVLEQILGGGVLGQFFD
jgi:hypothetical protein